MISIISLIDHFEPIFFENIDSVINQTFSDWELFIVLYNTNSSKDILHKLDIFSNPKIKILDFFHIHSYSQAILTTLSHCKFDYVSIFNLFDNWSPHKLSLQSSFLIKNKNIDILGTRSTFEKEISNIPIGELHKFNLFKINPFINSTIIIKKILLQHIEDSYPTFELSNLWLTLQIFDYNLVNLPDITVKHSYNILKKYNDCYHNEQFLKCIEKYKNQYMRIRFFSDFVKNDKDIKNNYENLCESHKIDYYGPTKKIYFTNSETYTHAILLNCPIINNLHVEKQNVIGLAFEPPFVSCLHLFHNNFIDYALKNIGKYFIGSTNNIPIKLGDKFIFKNIPSPPFFEHHSFIWHNPRPQYSLDSKNKIISIMVSEKNSFEGHQYRQLLVQHILKYNLPIDIWGRGSKIYKKQNYHNDSRIKGEFNSSHELFKDYKFSICIENCSINEYFSEKIIDCLIHNTVPIYWGCKNIENYFPNQTIPLTKNLSTDLSLLHNICKNPNKYLKNIDIESVHDKVNLIKHVESLFQN